MPASRSFVSDLRVVLQGRDFRKLFAVRLVCQAGDGAFQVGLVSLAWSRAALRPGRALGRSLRIFFRRVMSASNTCSDNVDHGRRRNPTARGPQPTTTPGCPQIGSTNTPLSVARPSVDTDHERHAPARTEAPDGRPTRGEDMPAPADREKALDTALAQIDRQFGKGSIMRLGDDTRPPIEVIPTGSIALDVALGIGGLPRGRVVEIFGPESSGKTTVALHAVANAQRAGGIVAFIDAEHALDPEYAKKLGVDTDALLVSQPDTGEQALEIADMLIRSGALDLIVIDSVAALVPRAEIEGEMGDSHVGLQARLMSQALRKITGALNNSGTTAIFINQLREKIGVMFGSPETTTGGRALKFYASVRLDIRRIETLKDGSDPVGSRTRVKVVKNKVSPPFKQAEFDILYGIGISREGGLIDMGVEQSFVRKSGAWYTYEGDQLGQGKENARAFLRDNPDLANELEKRIKEKLGVGPKLDAPADPPVEF
jgi:recombination protein RecA